MVATLDRPEVRNAIDQATIDALHELCAELEAEPRILILTGAGRRLRLRRGHRRATRAGRRGRASRDQRARLHPRSTTCRCPSSRPSTAGHSAAGPNSPTPPTSGSRRPSARFGNPETGLGIIAAAGASWRLPEIVGGGRAIELLLTGRIVEAEEALDIGLVSSIYPVESLLDAAHAIADQIAANDPRATQLTKAVFAAPRDAHPEVDLEAQAELFESPEKRRRMTEFLERKKR